MEILALGIAEDICLQIVNYTTNDKEAQFRNIIIFIDFK